MRRVVLLCGPPGAGKTTAARASGLTVYDRDDPQWRSDEAAFDRALASNALARPDARAVVIRAGATTSARARAAALIHPTHTFVLLAPRDELIRRVQHRDRADRIRTIAGIDRWLTTFERADGVSDFPGWAAIATAVADLGITSEDA